MQAFANDVAEKMNDSVKSDKESLDMMDNHGPLFSAGEIIFPDESIDRPYTRYGYKISNMNFLVPEQTVSEVIQNPKIFSLPNSPAWIEGLINIRGNIIPVMNIDKLLKNLSGDKLKSILVLNKTDSKTAIAILISDLPISLEIGESKTTASEYPEILRDYINDGFNQNNVDWIEFNPQDLFKKLANKVID
ncbi:MAG: chemotaxis protein CheW [Gammaproteobacteria bacterium]|nr:chemotaxis protein CheW [Gammaproteobacteria bacterium]MCW8986861.1 chemotaxis protein CheW [Gammaproteobacteria bacterium]MCW9030406.1 chemotaxis protein CheW [Gammaproteobacteria bacterium]